MTLWLTLRLFDVVATCCRQVAGSCDNVKVDHNVIFNKVFIQKNIQSNDSITKQDYSSVSTIFKNIHVRISQIPELAEGVHMQQTVCHKFLISLSRFYVKTGVQNPQL